MQRESKNSFPSIPQPLELQKQIPTPKKKVKPLLIFFLIFATILFVALLIYYTQHGQLIAILPSAHSMPGAGKLR